MKQLTEAPYRQKRGPSQGTEHLKGKRHLKLMKERDISNPDVYRSFCDNIGRSVPNFDKTDPLEDLKDYTDQCGGNGELTIEHFAAPPPNTSQVSLLKAD